MSEKKKGVSFSDFVVDDDDNILDTDQDLDQDLDVDDPDTDEPDEVELKVPAPPAKKVEKKQVKKDEPVDKTNEPDLKVDKDKIKDKVKKEIPKVEPDNDEPEPDEDEGNDPSAFFEEVEKITGTSVEVDYGDVDPLTPQGVALRDKALKEQTLDAFLEEIESKFPQAFRALQHSYNGGDVAELFTQTTGRDYSKIEVKDGDDNLAKEILKEYYKSKGIKSESRIASLIATAEDSEEGLIKEAQSSLNELKEEQESQRSKVLDSQKQKAAEQKKKDQIFVSAVDEVLESKKLGNFRITDRQEAAEFKKFVLSGLQRTQDGYALLTPLNSAALEKQLQYAYFQFKQGDLGKIIQQKVGTEQAKKLSLKFQQEQQKSKKATDQDSRTQITMKDFYES